MSVLSFDSIWLGGVESHWPASLPKKGVRSAALIRQRFGRHLEDGTIVAPAASAVGAFSQDLNTGDLTILTPLIETDCPRKVEVSVSVGAARKVTVTYLDGQLNQFTEVLLALDATPVELEREVSFIQKITVTASVVGTFRVDTLDKLGLEYILEGPGYALREITTGGIEDAGGTITPATPGDSPRGWFIPATVPDGVNFPVLIYIPQYIDRLE